MDRELVRWLVLIACGAWLGFASQARAFSDPSFYGMYPSQKLGGGGGRYFTGSPADGFGCSVCHTAPVDYHFPLYVRGLPEDGYIPGNTYTVHLQWPEAATWAQRYGTPMTALTAEFVAEDGGAAGTFQNVPLVLHQLTESCTLQAGETTPQFAQSILQFTSGYDPVALPLDPDGAEPCTAEGDGQHRCILTVRPCGASEAQMRWKAPDQFSGPIWFSAGFVATDIKSTQPNDGDYVTELSIAINPVSNGATYETELSGGCHVSGRSLAGSGRAPSAPVAWLALAFVACTARLRARRRRRVAGPAPAPAASAVAVAVVTAVAALSAGACADVSEPDSEHAKLYDNNIIGLFEPGPRLDAGTDAGPKSFHCQFPTVPGADADAGADKKSNTSPLKPISGTLTISFTTTPPPSGMGMYDKDGMTPDYGVVWIEDPARNYVKTLAVWGKDYLSTTLTTYLYGTRSGCKGDTTDVVTSATPASHISRSLTWTGANIDGDIVPQGSYVLWLELETQEVPHLPATQVPFQAGDMPWTMQIPPAPIHKDLTLTYTPKQ